jgi:hypothetical protein
MDTIRIMTLVRITSVDARLDRPGLVAASMRLVRRAVGVGLLSDRNPIERLDLDLLRAIAREASVAGVGQDAAVALLQGGDRAPAGLATLIERLDDALAGSPMPGHEIRELLRVYDHDGLVALTGASVASLRRYAAGTRAVPDAVAARIHFVALVTSDLAGSYNEFGLRRWWERPREPLGGRSPRAALGTDWSPDSPEAVAVAELAAVLAGDGAGSLAAAGAPAAAGGGAARVASTSRGATAVRGETASRARGAAGAVP